MKITYDHVTYRYQPDAVPALHDVSVEFDTSQIIGISGATGSGKSTFVQLVNGMLKPISGRVLIDLKDLHKSREFLRKTRQRVGMAFQFPERQFFGRTVKEELSYTLEYLQIPAEEIERRIESVSNLLEFDLQRHQNHSPFALSRSEQRKLGIAIMLSLHPELLILDEPTAGMDRASSAQLLDLLQTLHHHHKLQLILVSHNIELLLKYVDTLIVLAKGKIVFMGTPPEILTVSDRIKTFELSLPPVNRTLSLLREKYPQINPKVISIHDAIAEVVKYI